MYFSKALPDSLFSFALFEEDFIPLDFESAFAAPSSSLPILAAPQPGPVFAPPVNSFDLTDLHASNGGNGSEGFVVTNINPTAFQFPGISALGDVNNDGIDDFAIGDPSSDDLAGRTYIIFGTTSPIGPAFDVTTLNGTNGFSIEGVFSHFDPQNGQYGDRSGWSVDGGDINGDGINDIIIGAVRADEDNSPTNPNGPTGGGSSGEAYVIFGQDTSTTPFAANFQLSSLNGSNGFTLTDFQNGTQAGFSVANLGDINNDGIDDLAVGAPYADEPGTGTQGWLNGLTYIVFGSTTPFSATFDITTLNGTNGFVATAFSNSAFQYSGTSVEAAGDINNDGIADFVIGAPGFDINGDAGKSFVVFGTATPFSATFDLNSLNGTNGFVVEGNHVGAAMGRAASTGDFNGDGIDDLIIGGGGGDPNTGFNSEGQSIVIFGSSSPFSATLDSSTFTGAEGFVINGIDFAEQAGSRVSSAGDVNGDGYDDILVGAGGNPNNDADSYLIFGSASGHGGSLDLDSLPASVGLLLDGGHNVTDIGDFNNDGFDDFMVTNNNTPYVVLGSSTFGAPAASPLIASFDASNAVYVEHDGPTVIEGGITFSDPDSTNLTGATISIIAGFDATNDVLAFTNQNGITGSYAAGVLTLTGSATIADYNTALQSITFENLFITESTAARDISFTVTDGVTTSAAATRQFTFVINENIVGTAGADVINGDWGNDTLDGGAGADVINGGVGADTILGGAGADQNDGGADFDTIDYRLAASAVHFDMTATGTLGDANGDTYANFERAYGSNFNDVFTGTSANEFLHGEGGNDIINGGGGIDRIYGGAGNDVQRGQGGNDLLYGSAGSDQLNGGIGFDIVTYEFSTAAVNVNMQTGGTGGDAAGDTYFGVEAVYGSDFNDILTGASGTNELRGGLGNDIIDGSGGNDRLFGDAGADTLIGGTGLDGAYYTNATSAVTADLVNGGSVGDAAGDTYNSIEWIFGSDFDDTLLGDGGANRLTGGQGADTLDGRGGNDRLLGGDGNDTINGGAGVDSIFGQDGDDVMFGGADNDFFYGGAGIDSHDGGAGFDSISYLASSGGVFVDVVSGGSLGDADGDTYVSIERYFGSQFDDTFLGSAANETIYGYGGADALYGRQGNDSLFGGAGEDSFGFDPSQDGADVINDFVAGASANEYIFIFGGDPNIDSFAEVMSYASNSSGNTVFNFGGGNILTVIGVLTSEFTPDDFDFTETTTPQEPLDPGNYYGQDYDPANDDSANINAFFDFLEVG